MSYISTEHVTENDDATAALLCCENQTEQLTCQYSWNNSKDSTTSLNFHSMAGRSAKRTDRTRSDSSFVLSTLAIRSTFELNAKLQSNIKNSFRVTKFLHHSGFSEDYWPIVEGVLVAGGISSQREDSHASLQL